MWRALCVMLVALGVWAGQAQTKEETCRVRDPEISGRYVGDCNAQGWAEGQGVSAGAAARYEGGFANGTKHGRGTKTWLASGDVYAGEFASDYRHGQGRYVWGGPGPNASYQGSFDQDARHGIGTFSWPNGDLYTGPWRRDIQVGRLTPMQQIKRQHAEAWFKALGGAGQTVCAEDDPQRRAKLLAYANGEVTVQPSGPSAATVTSSALVWRACARSG